MGQIVLQLILAGLAMGFIYALVSIEYTIIWNASRVSEILCLWKPMLR